jgi:inosose dehydratase
MIMDRVAGAPISWGVCEVPGWGHQLSPEQVLPEMRVAHCSIDEVLSAALVVSAAIASAETGTCREVTLVHGAWLGGLREDVRV